MISGSEIKPKVYDSAVCCKISEDCVSGLQQSAISIWTHKWAAWAAQDWSPMTRISRLTESGNYPGRLIHCGCRQKAIKWHRRSGNRSLSGCISRHVILKISKRIELISFDFYLTLGLLFGLRSIMFVLATIQILCTIPEVPQTRDMTSGWNLLPHCHWKQANCKVNWDGSDFETFVALFLRRRLLLLVTFSVSPCIAEVCVPLLYALASVALMPLGAAPNVNNLESKSSNRRGA